MAVLVSLFAWVWAIVGLLLILLIITGVLLKIVKKKRQHLKENNGQIINYKTFPFSAPLAVKAQFGGVSRPNRQAEEKFLLEENKSADVNNSFSQLREKRSRVVDPLNGVLQGAKREEDVELQRPFQSGIPLEVSLVWASNDESLTMLITKLADFDQGSGQLFFQIRLESDSNQFQKKDLEEKKEFDPTQTLAFCFKGMSFEELQRCEVKINLFEKKRKHSPDTLVARGTFKLQGVPLSPNAPLNLSSILTPAEDLKPIIDLNLVWASNDESLTLQVARVIDLELTPRQLYLQMRLERDSNSATKLNLEEKKEFNPAKTVMFLFKGLTLLDIYKCDLKIKLLEKRTRFSKESTLAESSVSLRTVNLKPNIPTTVTTPLRLVKYNSLQHKERIVGTIQLRLKCTFMGQISAKFLIGINRATKLPFSMVGGEYKTELFLLRNNERIIYFSTSLKRGTSPEWNQVIAVNMDIKHLSEYALDLMVSRHSAGTGSSKIGGTTFRVSEEESTLAHWLDAIEHFGREVIISRDLKAPCHPLTLGQTEEKCLGMLGISLNQTHPPTSWATTTKFEVIIKSIAHLEFEKSGGEYKAEFFVKRGNDTLQSFTTPPAPSTQVVWNSKFIFTASMHQLSELNLDIAVTRVGKLRYVVKIGHATVGSGHIVKCQERPGTAIEEWYPIVRI